MHVHKELRDKLDEKARECMFIGYADGVKGYRLYDIKDRKIVISRDVIFDETPTKPSSSVVFDLGDEEEATAPSPLVKEEIKEEGDNGSSSSEEKEEESPQQEFQPRRSSRVRRAPTAWWEEHGLKEPPVQWWNHPEFANMCFAAMEEPNNLQGGISMRGC